MQEVVEDCFYTAHSSSIHLSFTQSLSASLCSLSFTVKTGSAFTEPLQYSASHLCFSGLRGQRPSTAELSSIPRHRELGGYLNAALSQTKIIQKRSTMIQYYRSLYLFESCQMNTLFSMDISQGRRTPLQRNSSLSLLHKHQHPCSICQQPVFKFIKTK